MTPAPVDGPARCFHGWTRCDFCGPSAPRSAPGPALCPACGRTLRRISGGSVPHEACPACTRRGFRALRLFRLGRR